MFPMLSPHGTRHLAHLRKQSVQMLLIGLCLGVTFGIVFIPIFDCDEDGDTSWVISQQEILIPEESQLVLDGTVFVPPPKPVVITNVTEPVFIRPRYMSTELGLRKKLIVGIVLSDATDIVKLLYINQTLTHYVDKVIMFINGTDPVLVSQLKSFDLPGVIAMTMSTQFNKLIQNETEEIKRRIVYNHVALKGIKYFADTFGDNYDYFFLSTDKYYIHGKRLIASLRNISVTNEILWGVPAEMVNSSCDLESGFVMSRSLVTQLGSRVARCLSSSVLLNKLSGSVAKCIQFLSPESICSNVAQGHVYSAVETTADEKVIIKAMTVGPISSPSQILAIHKVICKNRQHELKAEILNFEEKIKWLLPKAPENWRKLTWPIGLPSPHVPKTRFDVNKWVYFTSTTMYLKSEYETALLLRGVEGLDIDNILEQSRDFLITEVRRTEAGINSTDFEFLHGYRRFDAVRGMEYILDFEEKANMQMYRIEGLRPLLGNIEIIAVPFVTEARRLTIIVPITLQNLNQTKVFLDHWYDTTSDRKSNTIVILALVVFPKPEDQDQVNQSIRPENIETIKQLLSGYHTKPTSASPSNNASRNATKTPVSPSDLLKVGYVVVRLNSTVSSNVNPLQSKLGILDHLGKRSLGPNSLVLLLDPSVNVKDDFLNRVRMTTILNHQVYSPIPFVEYVPHVAFYRKEYSQPKELGISKNTGYFNNEETRVISFYYGDYTNVRKSLNGATLSTMGSLLNLFIQGSSLHIFRATEPALHIRFPKSGPLYDGDTCERNMTHCSATWWGSKAHLAKIVMSSGAS